MKIGIIIERLEEWRGGAETSTMELAALLAQRGHEMHIVTASRRPSTPTLTIHQLPGSALIRPRATAAFIRHATAFLKQTPFDVTHAIAPVPNADIYQPRGGSIVETIERNLALRGGGLSRAAKRFSNAWNLKYRSLRGFERAICRPDGPVIAAVSNYVADQFHRHYGLTPPRVQVVFNGVDVHPPEAAERARQRAAIRAQYGWSDEEYVLLCVAHNFRLKGVGHAVEALALLHAEGVPSARLLIVGRDNPAGVQSLAQRLGMTGAVVFVGPTQRIGAFFSAADVCVHPTYYDPCSRVVLEAICHGVPAVTTRFNGAAEVIHDGVSGFVVADPADAAMLAQGLLKLREPEVRAGMVSEAAALRPRLSMARHVTELELLLTAVAGRAGVASREPGESGGHSNGPAADKEVRGIPATSSGE